MSPHFVFPQTLRALEEEEDDGRIFVQNLVPVGSFRPSELDDFVRGVSFDLSDKEVTCIEDQDVFDRVYSLVRDFSSLNSPSKLNLVDSLRSNLSVLLPHVDSLSRTPQSENDDVILPDRVASYRNAFRIYTYFLFSIVLSEDSTATSSNNSKGLTSTRKKQTLNLWNWESHRGRILSLIANSLDINLSLLFGKQDPDENYLSFLVKNAFSMFENGTILKDPDTKDALCRIIGTCGTKYHYTIQTCASILHIIHKYDFAPIHVADLIALAHKKYDDGSLATSIIRDIGRTNPKDYVKDTVGAENVGRFLVEITERLPRLISTNIGILIPHFGGESYKIRNALVGMLGKLVVKASQEAEIEATSKSNRIRAKQAMLEILLERCRDVSAYTRSRVLQVWADLCVENSIPIGLWNEVAMVAAGRLEDKSAIVRKSALNLLMMMLQHNPFGPQLRAASYEATLERYKEKLADLHPNSATESVSNESHAVDEECNGESEVVNSVLEGEDRTFSDSLTENGSSPVDDGILLKDGPVPDIGNLEQTRALVASLEAGLGFSRCISSIMPILVQLLASSSATDVENTILLLMRCKQFQIDDAEACLRKMMPLVFSQDKSIYEAVENAFITIYTRKSPIETAKTLLTLAIDSNTGDLAALEFIVGVLVSKGEISKSTVAALWDFFCFNVSGTTAEQSRGALSILCMAAKVSNVGLGTHLQVVIDIGFGRWAKVDPLLARTACVALQRLSEEDKNKLLNTNGQKAFGVLESVITSFSLPANIWYAAADRAISTIYTLHPTPEILAAAFVKKSLSSVVHITEGNELPNDNSDSNNKIQVAKLSRCLFVASQVAMNQLVYIESCVRRVQKQKLKRERMLAENQNSQKAGTVVDGLKDNGINAELGLAASDDAMLENLSEKAEKEILSGGSTQKNLIGYCAIFVSKLCRNFSLMQKYPELQASGMLALCRFMIIDADFCNANLQLLFTVVENSPSETVRSNCTIALGDLAVRFPNLLEPWTGNMYARLRDRATSVRKNAILVLSHLILNDMMKVKGYINEMAARIEDVDERISNLAKLFFHELSKKGNNPIYNLLPDILGKLSMQNLERESFCSIMQFLIGSIKKDKQMESLIEKLCNRFNGVTESREWEHLSYCLSQLTMTEKGTKKFMELFKSYQHALSEETVVENLRNVVHKGKKFAKPEFKTAIEEFEERLDKVHMEKREQEITAKNAKIHQKKIDGFVGATCTVETDVVMGATCPENKAAECDVTADGEVIDPPVEGRRSEPPEAEAPKNNEAGECSTAVSEVVESEAADEEVLSPKPSSVVKRKLRNRGTELQKRRYMTRRSAAK